MEYIGHGGKKIVERVIVSPSQARERVQGLKQVAINGRIARECVDIAYGFFTPLEGFMDKADVEAVCERMALSNGTLWSMPIVFDIAREEIREKGIKEGDTVLLVYRDRPLAVLEVRSIFNYDTKKMSQVFGRYIHWGKSHAGECSQI